MTRSNSSSTNGTDGTNRNSNNNNDNNVIMQLELTDELNQQEIVTSYIFDTEIDSLSIELNHKYSKKKITSPIEFNWPRTMDTFTKELQRKKINPEHITMLCDVADNAGDKILKWRQNKQAEERQQEDDNRPESASRKILSLAEEQCEELFVDQYVEPYAAVKIKEHLETLNLNYTRFRNWICKAYYELEGSVPNSENVTNALNILKANAEFDGNSKELHLRVAYDTTKEDGTTRTTSKTIYYDLTNKEWEAIKITPAGWTIEKAPVIFRIHNAQPQVYPSKNYPPDIFDKFLKLLNVKGEGRKLLVKCYIIALFIPDIDMPILMLHGDPGAAKSTFEELVRNLGDPSSVLTFALPKDIFELVQQLDHNRIAYYDNVSTIPDWISDQFCRASTGGGSSKRRLYTDDDDKIYNFKRCVGFNGINLAATKSDLLDRGLIIRVERIDDKVKQKKEKIWQEFEKLRPQLLGYIFDILVKVLRMRHTTSIEFEKLPRMADFAEVAEIISRCMENKDNQFIDAYYDNIKLQTEEILETSLVASAILKFMHDRKEWNGNATELLEQLDQVVSQKTLKNKSWPKASNALSRRMNEIITNLREVGIVIEKGDADPKTRVKTIVITNLSAGDQSAIFWQQFDKLESSGLDKIVNGDELKACLVSSGIEDNHAVIIILEMMRDNKIEEVEYQRYRRRENGDKACQQDKTPWS